MHHKYHSNDSKKVKLYSYSISDLSVSRRSRVTVELKSSSFYHYYPSTQWY